MQMNKASFFKALSDPIRLSIIQFLLKKGECNCICDISKKVKRDQSVIYRHIMILENAGIIKTKKENNCLLCCIKDEKKIKKILEVAR